MKVLLRGIGWVTIRRGESDFDIPRQVFRDREYDFGMLLLEDRIRGRYEALLREGKKPIVVDAGANTGAARLWFNLHYPDAIIAAIEQEPGTAEVLRLNADKRSNITVHEAAVGSHPGHLTLMRRDRSWGVQSTRSESGFPIISIHEVIAAVPNGVPLLVKIDIEGFEENLLEGNISWLDRTVAVFIESHDWMLPGERSSSDFQKAFGTRNVELFIIGENLLYIRA